jgi:pre-mRNA-splicing factor SYF1
MRRNSAIRGSILSSGRSWNDFEVETGSEDTFKEFLRIRRSVQSLYNTEVQFLAAHALAGKKDGSKTGVDAGAGAGAGAGVGAGDC